MNNYILLGNKQAYVGNEISSVIGIRIQDVCQALEVYI